MSDFPFNKTLGPCYIDYTIFFMAKITRYCLISRSNSLDLTTHVSTASHQGQRSTACWHWVVCIGRPGDDFHQLPMTFAGQPTLQRVQGTGQGREHLRCARPPTSPLVTGLFLPAADYRLKEGGGEDLSLGG